MENKELLDRFDRAVAAMGKKAALMKDTEYVGEYVKKLKSKRAVLVKALEKGDEKKAQEIIDLAISFGKEVDGMNGEKQGLLGFIGSIFPNKKRIKSSPSGKKDDARQQGAEHREWYERQMNELREELAKREVEVEGIKGAYASLSAEVGSMRAKMEERQATDVRELKKQIDGLKEGMELLHGTMQKEFSANKEAYRGFSMEMLNLAIKLAEVEESMEKGDSVTEVDVIELNNAVAALEHKLSVIEVEEKKKRVELIEKMEKERKRILRTLDSKADTKKIVNTIKQHMSELQGEIEDRDSKIAADMHVELKSSYYTLSEKMKKIGQALEKAKSKKDLQAIRKSVDGLEKSISKIRKNEEGMEQELERQQLSDKALLQRIGTLSEKVKGMKEGDVAGIRKSIDALERELRDRDKTKKVESMMGSLSYLKGQVAKIEENLFVCDICGRKFKTARGLFLHKKMAHRTKAVKKKAAKGKKAAKKKKTKKKKLFGILGG